MPPGSRCKVGHGASSECGSLMDVCCAHNAAFVSIAAITPTTKPSLPTPTASTIAGMPIYSGGRMVERAFRNGSLLTVDAASLHRACCDSIHASVCYTCAALVVRLLAGKLHMQAAHELLTAKWVHAPSQLVSNHNKETSAHETTFSCCLPVVIQHSHHRRPLAR